MLLCFQNYDDLYQPQSIRVVTIIDHYIPGVLMGVGHTASTKPSSLAHQDQSFHIDREAPSLPGQLPRTFWLTAVLERGSLRLHHAVLNGMLSLRAPPYQSELEAGTQ